MIKVSVNDMQCVETRPRVHTFTSASPLNNNNIIGSHNYPSTCNKESLIAENERRDYGRVRNHLKVILSNQSVGLFL